MERSIFGQVNLSEQIDRIGAGIKNILNPNFRHDEPEEKKRDEDMEMVRARHRFQSFAKQRPDNLVKWYIDGHDYFYAVSELLESATQSIFIQDWWLSPELYLRRPPSSNEQWRLDRILKRKAEAGVHVCVIVYKEVNLNMTLNSAHTRRTLEGLHPNIACMRHPDHFDGDETVLFWSHHQKVIVVDARRACVGGLDLCFGRWDTHSHSLADCHISDFTQTVWPGQDYNNARVQDFQDVGMWASNQQSRLEVPRMPWHDTHMMIEGSAVLDICQHFVERWNFIYQIKYAKKRNSNGRYQLLAFPHPLGDGKRVDPREPHYEPVTHHPHFEHWGRVGRHLLGGQRSVPSTQGSFPVGHEEAPRSSIDDRQIPAGGMDVQVVRSAGDWSNGTTTERSILNAYIQLIEQAEKFIYIENQFFITTCGTDGHVRNQVGLALANRIIRAARAGENFKVVVAIPAIPGFAGNLDNETDSGGTLAIMDWTYKSICRGPTSIFSHVQNAGVDPRLYISFYNLRNFDRINNDPATLAEIERRTGISYYKTQAALARLYLGDYAGSSELEKNRVVKFKLAQVGESVEGEEPDLKARGGETLDVPLPETVQEAREILRGWSSAAPGPDAGVVDSVVTQPNSGGLEGLSWLGDENSERDAFVSEELYIHTKLMIVDDRKVIMGSANINDRSLLGDRDSEIALVVEDKDMVESQMDGQDWLAARFAATLRRKLYKEHLGMLEPQSGLLQRNEPTRSMLPVNVPQDDEMGTEADQLVTDPMGLELDQLWTQTARVNTECFSNVFRCVPAAGILTWDDYKQYVPTGPDTPKVCHVSPSAGTLAEVKDTLSQIRGHLVEMPLDFLEQTKMVKESASVNPVTMPIYT